MPGNWPTALLKAVNAARAAVGGPRAQLSVVAGLGVMILLFSYLVGQAWVSARAGAAQQGLAPVGSDPRAAPVQANVQANASLGLSPEIVMQNGTITVSGSGFGPLETVIVTANDPTTGVRREISRASTDWQGTFGEQPLELPAWLSSGAQQLEAIGERSGSRAIPTLFVRAKERWVNLSSYGLRQAERFGFVVGGFEPGEDVNVYLGEGPDRQPGDDMTPVLTLPADKAGNTTWTEMSVPLVKAGTYSLMFRPASGGEAVSRNIVINALSPSVDLSPWSGAAGSRVELNGTGFVPGEEVGVYLGDATDPAVAVNADDQGNFWGAGVTLPYEGRGQFRVTFIGQASRALVTRTFGVITPKPWVELSVYSGYGGTAVYFSGGGFAARERVTVHIGEAEGPTLSVGAANEQGYYQFIGPVNVPPAATGKVVFVLVGDTSHTKGTATFTVITPWYLTPSNEQPNSPALSR